MKYEDIYFVLSLSILIPVLLGLRKLILIDAQNTIIIVCICLGALTECLFYFINSISMKNSISNMYVLIEAILIVTQLYVWRGINNKWTFWITLSMLFTLWCITTILFHGTQTHNNYFRIGCSLIIVIMSINLINSLIFTIPKLIRDFRFVFAIGFLLFYTFNVLVEPFCIQGMNLSASFILNVFSIKSLLNAFTNLLYASAIVCIPQKRNFILQF